ncbi:MAG: M56 family metallopeptidase [Hamadaea sp.]|nr:M56 family metallopeptidase [Hamadaea sp.]
MNEAVCLLIYAAVTASLIPLGLPRLTRAGRSPRLGIAAWLGAAASVLVAAAWAAGRAILLGTSWPLRLAAVGALTTLACRVAWSAIAIVRESRSRRHRHRDGLLLLGAPDADLGALVVDAPQPMAYCLPGRDGLVVVTSGARAALTAAQLRAVLAHERGHLAGHHHVALAAAYALARIVPWLPLFAQLRTHVPMLLEMRADDLAARAHGRAEVAHAIDAMARTPAPAGSFGVGGPSVHLRVRRLRRTVPQWRLGLTAIITAIIVAALSAGPFLATVDPWCEHLHL